MRIGVAIRGMRARGLRLLFGSAPGNIDREASTPPVLIGFG
jgi:hypothetical protein